MTEEAKKVLDLQIDLLNADNQIPPTAKFRAMIVTSITADLSEENGLLTKPEAQEIKSRADKLASQLIP